MDNAQCTIDKGQWTIYRIALVLLLAILFSLIPASTVLAIDIVSPYERSRSIFCKDSTIVSGIYESSSQNLNLYFEPGTNSIVSLDKIKINELGGRQADITLQNNQIQKIPLGPNLPGSYALTVSPSQWPKEMPKGAPADGFTTSVTTIPFVKDETGRIKESLACPQGITSRGVRIQTAVNDRSKAMMEEQIKQQIRARAQARTQPPLPATPPPPPAGGFSSLAPCTFLDQQTGRCTWSIGVTCNSAGSGLPDSTPNPTHTGVYTALGCVPTQTEPFINSLFRFSAAFGGGVTLLLMTFGALRILASAGSEQELKQGREQFAAAALGLLFIIFSVLLLQIIGIDILRIPGFKI